MQHVAGQADGGHHQVFQFGVDRDCDYVVRCRNLNRWAAEALARTRDALVYGAKICELFDEDRDGASVQAGELTKLRARDWAELVNQPEHGGQVVLTHCVATTP